MSKEYEMLAYTKIVVFNYTLPYEEKTHEILIRLYFTTYED